MKNMNVNDMANYIMFFGKHYIHARANGKTTRISYCHKVASYTYYLICCVKYIKMPRKLKKKYKVKIMANLRYLDRYIPYKEFKKRKDSKQWKYKFVIRKKQD